MSIWEQERRQGMEKKRANKERLWRVLARNAFYILGGAAFGYVIAFALALAVIVVLDAAGVEYDDVTGAYVIAVATFAFLFLGAWAGLKHGERR